MKYVERFTPLLKYSCSTTRCLLPTTYSYFSFTGVWSYWSNIYLQKFHLTLSSLEILSLVLHLHCDFNLYSRKSNTFTKSFKVRSSSNMSAMTGSTVHRIYTGNGTEQCKGLGMMQCPRRVSVAQTTWSDLHRDPARLPCHLYPLTPGALYKRVHLFI